MEAQNISKWQTFPYPQCCFSEAPESLCSMLSFGAVVRPCYFSRDPICCQFIARRLFDRGLIPFHVGIKIHVVYIIRARTTHITTLVLVVVLCIVCILQRIERDLTAVYILYYSSTSVYYSFLHYARHSIYYTSRINDLCIINIKYFLKLN